MWVAHLEENGFTVKATDVQDLNAVWHSEGGKGTQGNLVKFQVRPNPLAH